MDKTPEHYIRTAHKVYRRMTALGLPEEVITRPSLIPFYEGKMVIIVVPGKHGGPMVYGFTRGNEHYQPLRKFIAKHGEKE